LRKIKIKNQGLENGPKRFLLTAEFLQNLVVARDSFVRHLVKSEGAKRYCLRKSATTEELVMSDNDEPGSEHNGSQGAGEERKTRRTPTPTAEAKKRICFKRGVCAARGAASDGDN
jgi:hypothetical protein